MAALTRSQIMARVKSVGTTPERAVAAMFAALRLKPTANAKTLPGSPDFALPRRRLAVFVHGCFWHGHGCARGARVPKANRDYWVAKIARNRRRDAAARRALNRLGGRTLTIWECSLTAPGRAERRLRTVLEQGDAR
jgi:DNA mismatch endonuclease (patch repair protein)